MKVYTILAAITFGAAIAGCSSVATTVPPQRSASAAPVVSADSGQASVVTVRCTDSTSDAASLQRAINSSSPGALIEIGGTCLLDKGLVFLSDRTYAGYNTTGTVLKQDGRMSYILASQEYTNNSSWTGDPVTIRDLTIQCRGSENTNGLVVLNWQADVEEVNVYDCGGTGIVDTNTTANGSVIKNSSVNSRFENNFVTNSGEYGFEVQDSRNSVTDGYFDNNQIAFSGLDGVHFDNAAGWDISGNHLYGNSHNGIYASRLFGSTISNNYIEDFGAREPSGLWCGIVATTQGNIGSTIFNNKIFNDYGESAGARYIYLSISGTNYGTGYLTVTGNIVIGDRATDIGLSFAGGINRLVVASSGNEVARVGTVATDGSDATVTPGS